MNNSTPAKAENFKDAALVLRAINHKLRRRIFDMVADAETNVTDIYNTLKIEQSVASQHLAILRRAGFVHSRRDGKNIYYSANYARFEEVNALCFRIANPHEAAAPNAVETDGGE